MPKLVYVYGDDDRFLETLTSLLKQRGYSLEAADTKTESFKADLALICRCETASPQTHLLQKGRLTMDLDNITATTDTGENVHFTPTEFSLLTYLLKNEHRAVSRNELLPAVWGYENNAGTRVADDTVKRIRKKLQDTGLSVETVWGYGFKIAES